MKARYFTSYRREGGWRIHDRRLKFDIATAAFRESAILIVTALNSKEAEHDQPSTSPDIQFTSQR